jgi:hypothetical protein
MLSSPRPSPAKAQRADWRPAGDRGIVTGGAERAEERHAGFIERFGCERHGCGDERLLLALAALFAPRHCIMENRRTRRVVGPAAGAKAAC